MGMEPESVRCQPTDPQSTESVDGDGVDRKVSLSLSDYSEGSNSPQTVLDTTLALCQASGERPKYHHPMQKYVEYLEYSLLVTVTPEAFGYNRRSLLQRILTANSADYERDSEYVKETLCSGSSVGYPTLALMLAGYEKLQGQRERGFYRRRNWRSVISGQGWNDAEGDRMRATVCKGMPESHFSLPS